MELPLRYCDRHQDGLVMEIDHAIPVSRGGTDQPNNLTWACHDCNTRKGAQTYTEFGFEDLIYKLAGQTLPSK